jgi:hypothetical protein
MKKILIILSIIQLIGILSSSFIAKSLIEAVVDMKSGIIVLVILWIIYYAYNYWRNKSKQQ